MILLSVITNINMEVIIVLYFNQNIQNKCNIGRSRKRQFHTFTYE